MTLLWAWWCLKSPVSQLFTQPFIQVQIKEKTSRRLCITGLITGEFPTQRASNSDNVSIWWCHHELALTHWGRVTHICVSNQTIIGSDNGLSPGRHQAIIWSNAGILLIRTLGTNFSEIVSKIHTFSFKKICFKMSGKWQPFCLDLNVLVS